MRKNKIEFLYSRKNVFVSTTSICVRNGPMATTFLNIFTFQRIADLPPPKCHLIIVIQKTSEITVIEE